MTSGRRKIVHLKKGGGITCPVCGNDHACALFGDDAVFCIRVKEGCATRKDGTPIVLKDGMGWLHRLNGEKAWAPGAAARMRLAQDRPRRSHAEWEKIIRRHQKALTTDMLRKKAAELGISPLSLRRLGVGYDEYTDSLSFPMRDGKRKAVGIRLRYPPGGSCRYGALKGSENGLFIPIGVDGAPGYDTAIDNAPYRLDGGPLPIVVLMPEGPTNTGAGLDLGFMCVGRPSCTGGIDMLVELLSGDDHLKDVVIVADRDTAKYRRDQQGREVGEPFWPGQEGALSLAGRLLGLRQVNRLRIIKAPEGCKDLRDWLKANGGSEGIARLIEQAELIDGDWIKATRRRIAELKRRMAKPPEPMRRMSA